MPNYLVELPAGGYQLANGHDRMVVFAADAAGARRAAAGRYDGDGNALWNTAATVTELVVGTDLADAGGVEDWTAYARVTGGAAQTVDPIVEVVDAMNSDQAAGRKVTDRFSVSSTAAIVINAGGTGYIVDDIITISGGTLAPGGRAATARVTTVSTGAITGIEVVDPGDYTVLPTLASAVHTGAANNNADLDFTAALEGSYDVLMARLVTALAGNADLTSSIDMSEGAAGARLLTLATIGDNIGDATITVEVRHNGVAETVLVGALTHQGIAGAVLTAAIPASPLAPPRVHAFKS